MVSACAGKRVSGLQLLKRLVQHDNPDIDVRLTQHSRSSWTKASAANAQGAHGRRSLGAASTSAADGQEIPDRQGRRVCVDDLRAGTLSDWQLRAQVLEKRPLHPFMKYGRRAQMFSATLADETGSKVRAVFFGSAADKNYDQLEEGSWYELRNGWIKAAAQGAVELIFGDENADGIVPIESE